MEWQYIVCVLILKLQIKKLKHGEYTTLDMDAYIIIDLRTYRTLFSPTTVVCTGLMKNTMQILTIKVMNKGK
jgi:hypothetical protein